jgi:cytochrome c peroxidase
MTEKRKPIPTMLLSLLATAVPILAVGLFAQSGVPNPITSRDETGILSTYSTRGPIELTNAFFQSLGTNGRTCNSCHVSSEAWTVSSRGIKERFARTQGRDPIFRPVDGANCPSADVSTIQARRSAYSLLLKKASSAFHCRCRRRRISRLPRSQIPTIAPRPRWLDRRCTDDRCPQRTCLS